MLVLEDDFVKAFDLSDSEIKLELAVLLFQSITQRSMQFGS